jgi:hypothetical protein
MIASHTTKTAPSSIHSSSKNVWRACHSPTKRRRSSSRRRWTKGRRTPAKVQERNLLTRTDLVEQSAERFRSTARRTITGSAGLAVSFPVTGTLHIPIFPLLFNLPCLLATQDMKPPCPTAGPAAPPASTWRIQHGGLSWMSFWKWVLQRIKSRKMQTLLGSTWRKSKQRRQHKGLQMALAMPARADPRHHHRLRRLQQPLQCPG